MKGTDQAISFTRDGITYTDIVEQVSTSHLV